MPMGDGTEEKSTDTVFPDAKVQLPTLFCDSLKSLPKSLHTEAVQKQLKGDGWEVKWDGGWTSATLSWPSFGPESAVCRH